MFLNVAVQKFEEKTWSWNDFCTGRHWWSMHCEVWTDYRAWVTQHALGICFALNTVYSKRYFQNLDDCYVEMWVWLLPKYFYAPKRNCNHHSGHCDKKSNEYYFKKQINRIGKHPFLFSTAVSLHNGYTQSLVAQYR